MTRPRFGVKWLPASGLCRFRFAYVPILDYQQYTGQAVFYTIFLC